MRSTPFFMVYGDGQRMPTVVHDSRSSADAEAKRLASMHPGIAFFVLGTVAMAIKNEIHFCDIDPTDAPF